MTNMITQVADGLDSVEQARYALRVTMSVILTSLQGAPSDTETAETIRAAQEAIRQLSGTTSTQSTSRTNRSATGTDRPVVTQQPGAPTAGNMERGAENQLPWRGGYRYRTKTRRSSKTKGRGTRLEKINFI